MGLVQRAGEKPRLPDMPATSSAEIEMAREIGVSAAQGPRKSFRVGGNCNEMNVIGLVAGRPDLYLVAFCVKTHEFTYGYAIDSVGRSCHTVRFRVSAAFENWRENAPNPHFRIVY